MKVYRVYGSCSDWECRCECTMNAFLDKTKAENYLATQSAEMIVKECGFCDYNVDCVGAELEEIEVEE